VTPTPHDYARYTRDKRYPAGEFVYQNHGNAVLPQWVSADRSVDGEDIVLWHTFGSDTLPASRTLACHADGLHRLFVEGRRLL
jgi:Cu2+-containing amine oxidase